MIARRLAAGARRLMRFEQIGNTRGPMATLQLYAIWAVLSIGAAGALLAWWIM